MNEKELELRKYASERLGQLLALGQRESGDFLAAHRLDIEQIRSLMIQISVISFGAAGFSIPVLNATGVVNTLPLFLVGLFLIVLTSIISLWYVAIMIENSIITSFEAHKSIRNNISKSLANERFLLQNPSKFEEYQSRTEEEVRRLEKTEEVIFKRDTLMYALIAGLSLGIITIFLSFFKISFSL
jgi:hypothetical protein